MRTPEETARLANGVSGAVSREYHFATIAACDERVRELEAERDRKEQRLDEARSTLFGRYERGDDCKACGGLGVKAYPSTGAWRGGGGGQSVTDGVCDQCWGSGTWRWRWVDLRKTFAAIAALREVAAMVREWQAAKRASMAAGIQRVDPRVPDAELIAQLDRNHWARHRTSKAEKAIESRLLAAVIPEVSHG